MICAAICLLLPTANPQPPTANPAAVIGMDGMPHLPLKEARGKPQAFIFINHDCPICNAYSPEFDRLLDRFGSQVKIQLVYSEPRFTVAEAKTHAKQFGLGRLSAWLDTNRTFARLCGATLVPEAVLFDKAANRVWAGRIDDLYASLGVRRSVATRHDLRDALAQLSKGKRPTPATGQPVGCYILTPDLL